MGFDFSKLVSFLNGGLEEDRVSFVEFQDSLTPYSRRGQRSYTHSYGNTYLVDEQHTEYQVSDGEQGNRTESYDFLSYQDAKEWCDKLNKKEVL